MRNTMHSCSRFLVSNRSAFGASLSSFSLLLLTCDGKISGDECLFGVVVVVSPLNTAPNGPLVVLVVVLVIVVVVCSLPEPARMAGGDDDDDDDDDTTFSLISGRFDLTT